MKWLRKLIIFGLVLSLIGMVSAGGALIAAYLYIAPNLPDTEQLKEVQLQVPLKVLSEEGSLIAEYGEKRRNPVTFEQLPQSMVNAFVAAEDANFFTHPGVDLRGIARAAIMLALTGERRQGGSTITMQVARNFYLSSHKSYLRKLYEIFLALQIERDLSKGEILELYLNKIYLGHRSYGVGAAAQVYYGKKLDELTLAETAMIAGLPKAPSAYNPLTNPPRALTRRQYVLGRMHELEYIDDAQLEEALQAPITAKRYAPDIQVEAPYIAEMVRAHMFELYGNTAYTGGYTVHTTLIDKDQTAANKALRDALDAYSERHGYLGPEAQVQPLPADLEAIDKLLDDYPKLGEALPALVTEVKEKTATLQVKGGENITLTWDGMKWAQPYETSNRRGKKPAKAADVLAVGDVVRVRQVDAEKDPTQWRLTQIPKVSGALVSLRAQDGAIIALVGGYDFALSKFNRVTQAQRQPGSGFKAFIYSAALDYGYTPASIINDAPVVFSDPSLEGAWRPENYSGKFFGPTRLRYALTKSRNLVSIRLMRDMGVPFAIDYVTRFGFDPDRLPRNLSLSLGSANVTPLEMARGYAVLANGGFLIDPYVIKRIEQNGETLFEAKPKVACSDCENGAPQQPSIDESGQPDEPPLAPRVIDAGNRFLMYSMMQDVIRAGTATKARAVGREDIAGKTGTTNEQRDAWFNGYNQSIVANVWVGFDNNERLGRGEVGGRAALPAWIDYMKVALADIPDRVPEVPEDIVRARIDPETGLAANAATKNPIFEYFRREMAPEAVPESTLGQSPGLPSGTISPGTSAGAADIF